MGIAEIVLKYLEAFAWPATVLYLALRYRAPVDRLIARVANDVQEIDLLGVRAKIRPQTAEERAIGLRTTLNSDNDRVELNAATPQTLSHHAMPTRDLLNRYVFAEELVMRHLESRWGVPIQRQAAIDLPGRRLIADGIAKRGGELTIVEVKLVTGETLPEMVVQHEIAKVSALAAYMRAPASLVLAVVSTRDRSNLDELVARLRASAIQTGVPVSVEGFTVAELVQQLLGTAHDLG